MYHFFTDLNHLKITILRLSKSKWLQNGSSSYSGLFFDKKKNSRFPHILSGFASYLPQHCLYFLPLPHGHGSFLPILFTFLGCFLAVVSLSLVFSFLFTFFLSIFCLISAFNKYTVVCCSIVFNNSDNNCIIFYRYHL